MMVMKCGTTGYCTFPTNLKIPLTFNKNNSRVDAWNIVTQWHQPSGQSACRNPHNDGIPRECFVVPLKFNLQNFSKANVGPQHPEYSHPAGTILELSYYLEIALQ